VRINVPSSFTLASFIGRALPAAVAITLLAPSAAAGAASDPLAAAVARVTAAEQSDNRATAQYDAAQTRYFELADEQASSQREIQSLTVQQRHLETLGRARAVVAYMRGSLVIGDVLANGSDILDAARRTTMLDDLNATGNQVIAQLDSVTSALHDHQATLQHEISEAKKALDAMQAQSRAAARALADAGRAEDDLRVQLTAARKLQQLTSILRAARVQAAPSSGNRLTSSPGAAGRIIVHGTWVCPVQGPVSFTDTFGAPRSSGRRHQGNDLFAPAGTPLVAVTDGTVFFQGDPLGGNAAYVEGHDGNTYYYAHLRDYVGGARSVSAGELIGHLGNTGDASDAPPQLHFEIRPGSPNGRAIDPYPTLAAHCG
jgi:peptidoglycan LD-endopeptidase LytH